jgi:hypothetical protein
MSRTRTPSPNFVWKYTLGMANWKHVAKLMEGLGAWNEWRQRSDEKPDLSGLGLSNFSLNFYRLTAVDFSDASLIRVSFVDSICEEIDFQRANILYATFHSELRKCNFRNARIEGSWFPMSLDESDFTDARLVANSFTHSSLRTARGLGAVRESVINSFGIDTFFDAGGLPESLLRGSVPEEFIQYATSLVGTPIEFYSCFLSYSSKDDEFARRLYNDLQGKNIRTWFAPEELKIGDRFRSRIDESIRIHDKLVLILSANSVASDWVETEVESALERERKEGKEVLFPIAIDDEGFTSQQSWAADIRRKRHIGDFRKWKSHDDYTRAFDKLVRDLKKSQPPIIMKGG